jgi:hypothetical protein
MFPADRHIDGVLVSSGSWKTHSFGKSNTTERRNLQSAVKESLLLSGSAEHESKIGPAKENDLKSKKFLSTSSQNSPSARL